MVPGSCRASVSTGELNEGKSGCLHRSTSFHLLNACGVPGTGLGPAMKGVGSDTREAAAPAGSRWGGGRRSGTCVCQGQAAKVLVRGP